MQVNINLQVNAGQNQLNAKNESKKQKREKITQITFLCTNFFFWNDLLIQMNGFEVIYIFKNEDRIRDKNMSKKNNNKQLVSIVK